jgi:isocitrate/isopropylmalate dehydrogenase
MAVQMMLDYLGDTEGADLVESAVGNALRSRRIPSLRAGALPTSEVGDILIDEIKALAAAAG